jgi:hypothetical protein
MINFDDFFTKILVKILSRLSLQKNDLNSQRYYLKRNFYNISLCLRQLHKIIEVLLYAYIDKSCSIIVALITRTFLNRLRFALLIREAIIKIKNEIDITSINDELTSSFDYNNLRIVINVINVSS